MSIVVIDYENDVDSAIFSVLRKYDFKNIKLNYLITSFVLSTLYPLFIHSMIFENLSLLSYPDCLNFKNMENK